MTEPVGDTVQTLAAARAGSREALGQALETYRRYLLLVAQRELDPDLRAKGGASDLVQQTFLDAHRDFACFRGNSEAELRSWLRRMLLDNLANFHRHYRQTAKRRIGHEVTLEPGSSSDATGGGPYAATPSPSSDAMAQEQAEALLAALGRLADDYRRVIALRQQEQLSFEEIGQQMQRSPDAARKLWARAIEQLKRDLRAPP
jgi:RNA polymerase sigma-70 factor (ECF subfamily)